MSKRVFSTEFRREAASLVVDQNYTVTQACVAMGVGPTAMRRWVKQLWAESGGRTPEKAAAMTPEHQRIQELEARLRKVEREKEILKKATVGSTGQCNIVYQHEWVTIYAEQEDKRINRVGEAGALGPVEKGAVA